MPDSFHFPPEGPQSPDDRSLESLLSGDTSDIAASLRPVADTLNALRAAPSARELRGEAAARAQFRALRAEALADTSGPPTLDMPVVPAQRRPAPARSSRQRPFRIRLAGLLAAAAVVVLAAAVTYSGHLPSGLQRIAHDTIAAPPVHTAPGPGPGGVQATSARPVPPSTTAPSVGSSDSGAPSPFSAAAQGKKALCDQFWSDLKHSRPGRMSWLTPRYHRLVAAAGGAQNVFRYCYPVWDPKFAPQYQQLPSYPPFFPKRWGSETRGDGQGQNQNQGQGQQGQAGQQQAPASQQQVGQNQDQSPPPSPSASSGSSTGSSGGVPTGSQGQNSGSGQN